MAVIQSRVCDLCAEEPGVPPKEGQVIRLSLAGRILEADLCTTHTAELSAKLAPFVQFTMSRPMADTVLTISAKGVPKDRQCPICLEWFTAQGVSMHQRSCAPAGAVPLQEKDRIPCPHCDRTFVRLAKHMSSAHPGLAIVQLEKSA